MSDFVAGLRTLSEYFQFTVTLDDMLRDRLVCGIRDRRLQQRLLAETYLIFLKALDISQAMQETYRLNKLQNPSQILISRQGDLNHKDDQNHLTTKPSATDVEVHTRLEIAHLRMQSAITAKVKGTLIRCIVPRLGMKEIRCLIKLTKSLRP